MNKNLTISKIVLGITAAALISGPAFAAQKKTNSLHARPAIDYRAAPVQIFQGGVYHNDVLPDGTITGPIAPEVNGG